MALAPVYGPLEAVGLGDHVIGQHAAVGPAGHAQAVRIAPATLDGIVHRGHHIIEIGPAPVAPDGHAERLPVTGRAARVGHHDQVAIGGIQLCFKMKAKVVLRLRAAVDLAESPGIFCPSMKPGRGLMMNPSIGVPSRLVNWHFHHFAQLDSLQQFLVGEGRLRQFFAIPEAGTPPRAGAAG